MQRTGQHFKLLTLGCALLGSVALGGCGKKGPLYLPDEASVPKSSGDQISSPVVTKPKK